jgi:hypothetical protein
MNYGELKTYVRSLINRTDLTDALATQFIQQAQDRLERWPQIDPLKHAPRPSFMQKLVSFNLDGTGGDFRVPTDFLEIVDIYTSDGGEMARVDTSEWLRHSDTSGTPEVFVQTGHVIRMRPYPSADTTVYLLYYGTAPELVTNEDENYWSIAAVDAFAYAAASLAADYYEDERLMRFEQKFRDALSELQDQAIAEDLSGPMSITPAYRYDCD